MLTSIAPTLLWCATGLPSGADATDHQLARLGREVGDLSSGMRPAVRPFAGQAGSEGVPGLSVEIYPLDVPGPAVERTDPAINFSWGSAAPATGIPANRFGATWTGEVVPTVSGDYTFIARTDDGVRLYIDGALVIDRWVNQSARDVSSAAIKLKKDKAVTLRMEYYENTGSASARLSWSLDGGAATVIPQANLRSADRLNEFPPVLTGPTSGSGTVQVGAFTPLDGGVIHYTVDGSDPKSSSPTVSGGVITLNASANLRAAVRGSDGKFGPVATRTITVLGGGTGLLATYIGGTNPGAAPLLSRTDTGLYFNWRAAPPAAGLPADYFTARWEGELVPAWSEATTFSLSADDGARVYLGGKLIIDRFHGTGASTATVNLTAGQALPLVVEYVELAGNASVRLRWQSASMSLRDIPTAALRPVVQSVPDAAGSGLAASYFANTTLSGTPAAVQVEPRLDWRWGATAPTGLTAVDGWSARWEGAIIPRFTETYTLSIAADDGVRVWIDGVQKINDWRSRGHRTLSTTVALTAGRAHAIRVEKSDVSGNAGASLLWSSLSQQREVVPSWRLLPSRPPTVEELALAGAEDSTISGTAVASDPDGDTLAWSVKTQPGHGSVSVDAATGAVSYVPNLNYNGPDSFVLLVKDAFTETELPVSVAVAAVNDAPVAVVAPAATDEDTAVTVTPSASDVDGDALTWALDAAAAPAHGTLSGFDPQTGAVVYTPAADWNGSDSFGLVVSDGTVDTHVTVTVAVAPVNDAPVLAGIETALAWYRDGDAGLAATAALAVSDVDSTSLGGATVRIAGNYQPGDELLFTNQSGITGAYAAGTLTLSGNATLAQYQTALRSVKYRSTQAFPGTAARAIAFTVSDGSASNEVARTLGVVTRSTPPWTEGFEGLAIGGDLHQLELQGLTRWHAWNAAPGASALVSAAQARSGGASVAIAGATDLVKEYKGVNAGGWRYSAWQYIPTTFTGTSYFILLNTYRDTAGADGKNWSTQVKFTNSQVLPDFAGGSAAVVKGQWVELRVDIDFAADQHRFFYNGTQVFQRSWTGGTTGGGVRNLAAVDLYANGASPVYYDDISLTPIVPTISGGGSVAYVENAAPVAVMPALAVDGFGVAQLSGATVQLTGDLTQDVLSATVSGGISQSWNPATGTLTLSGNATPAVYQTVLRTVAFANGSDAPSLAPRTVAFAVTAPTGTSNSVSATVTVSAVNDAPLAQALSLSGDEDGVLTGQAVASDVDGGALTWTLASQPANGTATVDASGAVSYQPQADFAGSDSFTLTVSDGNGGSATADVAVTVNPVDDAAVITVPSGGSATPGSDLVLGAIMVADIDSPTVTIQVSVDAGTITLSGQPGAAASHTLTGTLAEVNAALVQTIWRAPAAAGPATLTVAGNGGSATVALTTLDAPAPIVVQPLAVTGWNGAPHGTQILPPASLWRFEVQASGRYHLWLRGTGDAVAVELDGVAVGALDLPTEAGWSCRSGTTVQTLELSAGTHEMRLLAAPGAIAAGMLVSETAAGSVHDEPLVVGPGSVAVFEAEDYDDSSGRDGTAWLPVAYGAATALRALPDIGRVQESGSHTLAYDVWVTAPGTYRLWIRASGAGDSDSINVAVDGVPALSGVNPESWPWSTQNLAWGAMNVDLVRSDFTIAAAGLHRITVSFREDGVALDQLAVSGIPAWRPGEVPHPTYRRQGVHLQGADQTVSLDVSAAQLVPARVQHAWVRQGSIFPGEADVLRAMPDIAKQVPKSDVASTAAAFWQVRFGAAGTYAVWVRGTGADFSSDSWHIGIAGDLSGSGDLSLNQNQPAAALAWSNTRQDGTKATITVPAPGDYAIGLWMREDGAALQRLVIQPSTATPPVGSGPATSPRVSAAPAGDG